MEGKTHKSELKLPFLTNPELQGLDDTAVAPSPSMMPLVSPMFGARKSNFMGYTPMTARSNKRKLTFGFDIDEEVSYDSEGETGPTNQPGAESDDEFDRDRPEIQILNSGTPTPLPRKSCFSKTVGWLKGIWTVVFFTYTNRFYRDKDFQEQCENIDKVDSNWTMKYQIRLFQDAWDKYEIKNIKKEVKKEARSEQGRRSATAIKEHIRFKLQESKRDTERRIDLMKILFSTVRTQFYWAVFYKILYQIAALTIPFIMGNFLSSISKSENLGLVYSSIWCVIACLLTFLMGLFNHHCIRVISGVKSRVAEELRDNLFMRILDLNIEFCYKAHSSFLTKMLLYECGCIGPYFVGLCNLIAAPVSVGYAGFIIYIQFKANPYLFFIVGYILLVMVLVYSVSRFLFKLKRKYRSIGSRCAGYLEEIIRNNRFIKINSLQNMLLRNIWGHRRQQRHVVKQINVCETIFDFVFNSPLMASTLVLYAVHKSRSGPEIDPKEAFTVIATMSSLRSVLSGLNDCLNVFLDFRPAISLFNLFFRCASRTPKIAVMKVPLKPFQESSHSASSEVTYTSTKDNYELISDKVTIQYPRGFDRRKLEVDRHTNRDNLAIGLEECCFVDKTDTMKQILKTIFREDFLGDEDLVKRSLISNAAVLSGTNLRIEKGDKVCVMGREGSGRQFFMNALSNEHELEEGLMVIKGKLVQLDLSRSYILEECTILENIILDNLFFQRKFDKICNILALDLSKFSHRTFLRYQSIAALDLIDRVKILLARALYQDFDILALNNLFDTLTTNDRNVLFDSLVLQYLKFDTVIFHSNDPLLARKSDLVLVFKDNELVEQGTYYELIENKENHFNVLIRENKYEKDIKEEMPIQIPNKKKKLSLISNRLKRRRYGINGIDQGSILQIVQFNHQQVSSTLANLFNTVILLKRALKTHKKKLQRDEEKLLRTEMQSENIEATLKKMVSLAGPNAWKSILVLFGVSTLISLTYDVWVGWWSSDLLNLSSSKFYFSILVVISLNFGIYLVFRDLIYNKIIRRISSNIYFANLKKIVRANSSWYELFRVPNIVYSMIVYQSTMDDDFAKGITSAVVDVFMIATSLLISNTFYPGVYLVVTIAVVYYCKDCVNKVLRANRIWLPQLLAAKISWFGSYVTALKNTVAMRQIGKDRYLYSRFEKPAMTIEAVATGPYVYSVRWLGIRMAGVSAFLVFWVYLCPVLMNYWDIWKFKERVWLLGIVLTWSGRTSSYLSELTENMVNLQVNSEAAERLMELQNTCPHSLKSDPAVDSKEIEDELNEAEIHRVFMNSSDLDKLKFKFDPKHKIIEIKNLSFKKGQRSIFKNLNLDIYYGDRVALVQSDGNAVSYLINLLFGFENLNRTLHPQRTSIQEIHTEVKIFGRDILAMKKYILRRRESYLPADPPVFSGTLRDNIDPFHLANDEDIIRILHYLGFHLAFQAYLRLSTKEETLDYVNRLINQEQKGVVELINWVRKAPLHYFREVTGMLSAASGKLSSEISLNTTGFSRNDTSPEKEYQKTRRLRMIVKVFLALRGLLIEVRKKRKLIQSDALYQKDVLKHGVISDKQQSLPLRRSVSGIKSSGLEINPLNSKGRASKKAVPILQNHTITSAVEREIIQKLLSMIISTDDKQFTVLIRRIINLTRVLLESPALLIIEEQAMHIDSCLQKNYIECIFASLPQSTILCKMTTCVLKRMFTKYAYFVRDSLVKLCNPTDDEDSVQESPFIQR